MLSILNIETNNKSFFRAEFWRQQQPLYSKGNKNLQKSETGETGENSETSETSDSSSARGADILDSISPPSS